MLVLQGGKNLNLLKELTDVLDKVEKPSRYIGNEYNVVKNKAGLRFCLVFPDLYDVGMSHFGVHILYNIVNSSGFASCERSYLPWFDMQELMEENSIPLYSYETYSPLNEFDVVGFTLQYEMAYTNVLRAMKLGGIPTTRSGRTDGDPIVIAGGPCAFNPAPMERFIDAFLIGDGEEAVIEMMKAVEEGKTREEKLQKLSEIPGVYVPDHNREISKRVIGEMKPEWAPTKQIVPYTNIVHDRAVVEILRGCTHGCRFCQAGMIYRPVRERSAGEILEISQKTVEETGQEELSLLSLSSADHTQIKRIVDLLKTMEGVSVSIPSTRVDAFGVELADAVSTVRKSGITLAPEAGTQRLRDVINKGIDEEQIFGALKSALEKGWTRVKLYFMIGLPTETDEDVIAIGEMLHKTKKMGFKNVSATLGLFVPKAYTPFEFSRQISPEEAWRRYKLIGWARRFAKVNFTDPYKAVIEGVLSRGGEEVSQIIEKAEERDMIFSDWDERFDSDRWFTLFEECGIDLERMLEEKDVKEPFPWDHINSGTPKRFLWLEYNRAKEGKLTKDCREGCTGCGVCPEFDVENILKNSEWVKEVE